MELEYCDLMNAAYEGIWLRIIFHNRGKLVKYTLIICDDIFAIKPSMYLVPHPQSKHMQLHYHFVREKVEEGSIEIYNCKIVEQVLEIMMKALAFKEYIYYWERLDI